MTRSNIDSRPWLPIKDGSPAAEHSGGLESRLNERRIIDGQRDARLPGRPYNDRLMIDAIERPGDRVRDRVGGVVSALCVLVACGGSSPAAEKPAEAESASDPSFEGIPVGASPLDFVLRGPETHDLGIPADFFRKKGRGLSEHPGVDTCRVKGLAIADEWLIVSCTIAAGDDARLRATAEKSHVLAARLADVLADGADPSWTSVTISEPLSPELAAPIAETLRTRSKKRKRRKKRRRARDDDVPALRIVAGLASGIARDVDRDGVWIGATVDARQSRSALHLIDPTAIGKSGALLRSPALTRNTLELPGQRADALTVVDGQYLLVVVGDSEMFVIFDLEGPGQASAVVNPLRGGDDHVAYRDCKTWRESIIVCAGIHGQKPLSGAPAPDVEPSSRVHVLRVDTVKFPDIRIDLLGAITGDLTGDGEAAIDLGTSSEAGKSSALVTAGGMEIDMESGHVYLLAGQLPGAELVRVRLTAPRE